MGDAAKKNSRRVGLCVCAAAALAAALSACSLRGNTGGGTNEAVAVSGEEAPAKESFYKKLQEGSPVRILIVGDSIGEGEGTSETGTPWFDLLAEEIESTWGSSVDLTNLSMGGNASYAGYVRTMALDAGTQDDDLAILCYGHNDKDRDFALYYEALIRAVRTRCPSACIIAILESSLYDNTIRTDAIRSLAGHYGIQTADTIAAFESAGVPYESLMTADGVHPNDSGQVLYDAAVRDVIEENVALGTEIPEEVSPADPAVHRFDHFVWYGKEQWTRQDGEEIVYTLPVTGSGMPGLDHTCFPGANHVEIRVDDRTYATVDIDFDYDFSQRYIRVLGEQAEIGSELQVIFENSQQADGFYGMCLNW